MSKPKPYVFKNLKNDDGDTRFFICGMAGLKALDARSTYGWFNYFCDAHDAVLTNQGGIEDHRNDYMLIEEIKEGVYGLAVKEWWFNWSM